MKHFDRYMVCLAAFSAFLWVTARVPAFASTSGATCQAAAPMLNTNSPFGVVSDATNIKHALAVSSSGKLVAYIYVQKNLQALFQDGLINAQPVPEAPRERLFAAIGLARSGVRSKGGIYPIASSAIVKIINAGFSLQSCY